jgi:hypothetical protein
METTQPPILRTFTLNLPSNVMRDLERPITPLTPGKRFPKLPLQRQKKCIFNQDLVEIE